MPHDLRLLPSQINSKGSVVLSTRCRGLWRECVWDKFVKIWTCDVFSSYLNPHPAAIILTRTLLITSSIASAGAFLCLLLGFKYFSCCQEPLAKQHWLCLAAGLFFLVGAWHTSGPTQTHSEPRQQTGGFAFWGLPQDCGNHRVLCFVSGISTSVGVTRYCVYVYSLHQYEVSLKIPGFPSFEYGYSLWMAVGGSLGAIVAAGVSCYEVLFKKDPRANAVKAVAGSGCTAGMDIVRTYV
ncbi:claudin-16-like isoform X1 [Mauremys mutica]|uniref:claudin-16-like isoform X1 n=1 Tax=Mauremys mutica TaxID=74926 RepID=UPI001D15F614|nr:claudin-16-like isoform X1 [Mauremys mutica]